MKSGISLCEPTVLKKNLTRFAPAWALYALGLLMTLALVREPEKPYYFARNLADTLPALGVINALYALLTVQLLWSDLYSSRMCHALHALPPRRETLFSTHLISGLLFSWAPNALMGLLILALLPMAPELALYWFLVCSLQYLFFFALATLCATVVGTRFALGAVYVMVNLLPLILFWLVDTVFVPLLYGVVTNEDLFLLLTPVYTLASLGYVEVNSLRPGVYSRQFTCLPYEGWGYLAICAALALGMLILALVCYRRRHLETAGDFLSARSLTHPFLWLYTLCVGMFCHMLWELFWVDDGWPFLALGFVIGWFTGRMLLQRTVRVFRPRVFGGLALFSSIFALAVGLTALDPLGITRWVPAPEKVARLGISADGSYPGAREAAWSDLQNLQQLQSIHRSALEDRDPTGATVPLTLSYHMKDGRVLVREYRIPVDGEPGRLLGHYLSDAAYVLGEIHTQQLALTRVDISDPGISLEDPTLLRQLREAILADCAQGNLSQSWRYLDQAHQVQWFTLEATLDSGLKLYRELMFTEDAAHILAWLQSQNIQPTKYP